MVRRRVLWGVFAVSQFIVLSAWALGSPPFSYADEAFHMLNSYCVGSPPADECRREPSSGLVTVPERIIDGSRWWWDNPREVRVEDPRNARYSPVYYWVGSRSVDGDLSKWVLKTRLVNALLATALITLALALSHETVRRIALNSWVLIGITYGFFYAASNHPLSWSVAGVAALCPLFVSVFRHAARSRRLGAAMGSACAAGIALMGRRESIIAIAMILIVVGSAESRGWSRMGGTRLLAALAAVVAVPSVLLAIGVLHPIAPFNRDGFGELWNALDGERIYRFLWEVPVVYLKLLGGTRYNDLPELESVGYWAPFVLGATMLAFAAHRTSSIRNGSSQRYAVARIVTLAVLVVAPVAYSLPRGSGMSLLPLLPSRYVLLIGMAGMFLLLCSVDPNGFGVCSRGQYKVLSLLVVVGHGTSLYFVFITQRVFRVSVDSVPVVNLAGRHAWMEDWWTSSLSPLSVWLVGSLAMYVMWSVASGLFPFRAEGRDGQ
jgi:hypothetical protein